ncbi:hypothetical protein [Ralstonia solanacearum]|uniref:hypothetical protein n=1 Tax=Ralstonia solanacearum TaxID=305 RepID=UPI00018171AF|nr:hypothetical protein [Ralstonia solanacearum]MDC6176241.1 hypothetical protein [Ralstonia solanacearum]MDC6239731.1 hypothetical protein [Ralstonia solanacearum]
MKASIETSPTGFRDIAVAMSIDWMQAPERMREILGVIGAADIVAITGDDAVSVEVRWWDFTFKNEAFRIVYEEWPGNLSIEPKNASGVSLLPDIEKLMLAA